MGREDSNSFNLAESIERAAREHSFLSRGDRVVVAVSGGLDSACLLDGFVELRDKWSLSIHVVHLNHMLRGSDSDADQEFVRQKAETLGLPFHTCSADCAALASQRRRTIEETAREERRSYLMRILEETGADRIATGHHRDDQAETVLFRLLRGSGTTGLSAIRPRTGVWIRPLLSVTRSELEAYAASAGLEYREDHTNRDLSIPRNRIRHRLIPLLEQEYEPRAIDTISRAAEVLQADDDALAEITLDAEKTTICARSGRKIALDGASFFGYHIAVQRRMLRNAFLRAGLDPRRLTFRLIDRILTRFSQGPGVEQVATDLTACFTGRLILLGTKAPVFEEHIGFGSNQIDAIDAKLTVEDVTRAEFPTRFDAVNPFVTWLNRSFLPKDLVLRTVRPGDRIRPFGAAGSAKVSDVLIDRKVPRLVRDEVPVLADRNEVLWIVGVRASETTRIDDVSNAAYRLQFDGSWRHLYSAMEQLS